MMPLQMPKYPPANKSDLIIDLINFLNSWKGLNKKQTTY